MNVCCPWGVQVAPQLDVTEALWQQADLSHFYKLHPLIYHFQQFWLMFPRRMAVYEISLFGDRVEALFLGWE